MQSVTSRSQEFCSFLEVPVPEKIGPGKKYRYRYRKNFVPEKSTGTGTEKFGPGKKYRSRYRKKLVPKKSTGIGKNSGYRHTLLGLLEFGFHL